MADLNDLTQNVNIWDDAKTKAVTVTTDGAKERLDTSVQDLVNVSDSLYRGIPIARHLILDGTEPYTFTKGSLNVDGSGTVKNFYRTPPSSKKWYISSLKVTIEDESINHTKFGGITSLTNGILFKVTEGGSERDFYEHSIKKNGTFYHLSTASEIDSATTDILSVLVDLTKWGTAIELLNSTSDNFKVVVQDDLTALSFMECVIFGYEVDE